MAKVNVYLTFDGNCEEAFNFYKTVFGGDFDLRRFSDMPPQEGMPPMTEAMGRKIMHVSYSISEETMLMASDKAGFGPDLVVGNNFSISVNPDSEEEAYKIFKGLSIGGTITMPIEKTFWNALFGMCTDRFGINWMVNYLLE